MRSRRICSIPTIFLLALGANERNLAVADRSAGAAAASSALNVLKKLDYRYFVAGGTCAAISHGITTPIDVVRAVEYRYGVYERIFTSHAPFVLSHLHTVVAFELVLLHTIARR
jgi:hypothetical protein